MDIQNLTIYDLARLAGYSEESIAAAKEAEKNGKDDDK